MDTTRTKVLYIAGWGRSGSTILGNVLGQIDRFFFVGEILNIWGRYLIEDRLCACGLPASRCELWTEVIHDAFGAMELAEIQEMDALRKHSIRNRYIPEMLIPGGKTRLRGRLGDYLANLNKLYRSVQKVTGASVIVDSSKRPTYAYLLELVPTIELHVIHLVRDSRAVAYSWQRQKIQQEDNGRQVQMQRYGPGRSTLRWNLLNRVTEMFWRQTPERYMLVRYEDFIDHPWETIQRIAVLIKEQPIQSPLVTENAVELSTNHAIWGNPIRFTSGPVVLQKDETWKLKMRQSTKGFVTALSWPLLIKYGYPIGGVLS